MKESIEEIIDDCLTFVGFIGLIILYFICFIVELFICLSPFLMIWFILYKILG